MADAHVVKPDTFRSQRIDIRRLHNRVAVTPQSAGGLIVGKEKYDVRFLSLRIAGGEQHKQENRTGTDYFLHSVR